MRDQAEPTIYSPRCGRTMEYERGALTCRAGRMLLAPALEKALRELVERALAERPAASGGAAAPGWFCPRCAGPMRQDDPHGTEFTCPQCGLHLPPRVVFQLIELHLHARV